MTRSDVCRGRERPHDIRRAYRFLRSGEGEAEGENGTGGEREGEEEEREKKKQKKKTIVEIR